MKKADVVNGFFFFFLSKNYDVTYQLKLKIKNLTRETHVSFFSFFPSFHLFG